MGIRFHCPNGHKLNVKSFLAGKKGVCPDCGVKLRIPERSEAGLDSGIDEEQPAATKTPENVPTSVAAPKPASNLQPAVQAVVRAVQPAYSPQPVYQQVAPVGYSPPGPGPAPMQPQYNMPVPPPPPGAIADPIAENPLATWFVRPPSGGQFGPARGEVMRKWLTEGRVTSDSLVWREGWVDWLAATEVFPSLMTPAKATVNLFTLQTNAPTHSTSIPIIPSSNKKNNSTTVVILVSLVMVCIILGIVLALVISGQLSLPGETPAT